MTNKPPRVTVSVDPDVCIGSGMCAADDPERFTIAEDVAEATVGELSELDQGLLDVARRCPSGAIEIRCDGEPVDLF